MVRKTFNRVRNLFWGAVFAAFWRRTMRDGSAGEAPFQVLIRGGTVLDGSGGPPLEADVGIARGRIAAIGDLARFRGRDEYDARGLVVAPGFVNPLSWATESLLADPSSESDIRQGVTLEVFGEGVSMGPLTPAMRRAMQQRQSDYRFDVDWSTLGEYLETLERRGVVPNVASFVGATTLRVHEIGHASRAPSREELARMCELVRVAMREGALGVGSALIYAPAAWASTGELLALASAAAEYGGTYATHLRSESDGLLAALEEALEIGRLAGCGVHLHHLKAAGRASWPLMEHAIARIERARAEGQDVTANMYPYESAASGLDAAMPLWVQEGGHAAWLARLRDPLLRARVEREMREPGEGWENLYAASGGAGNVLLLGFRSPGLRPLAGRTLADVAAERGRSPEATLIDLVLEDESRATAAYFMMSEDNVRRQLALPWVSICSDEESLAPRSPFMTHYPHPRAYGAFARFLGPYVREAKLVPLAEAVRRMTALPADALRIADRGRLAPGAHADVVVFDARRIADRARYDDPRRFATGMHHVLVNGVAVLRDGELTGARPGRFVRGPGYGRARPTTAAASLPRAAG